MAGPILSDPSAFQSLQHDRSPPPASPRYKSNTLSSAGLLPLALSTDLPTRNHTSYHGHHQSSHSQQSQPYPSSSRSSLYHRQQPHQHHPHHHHHHHHSPHHHPHPLPSTSSSVNKPTLPGIATILAFAGTHPLARSPSDSSSSPVHPILGPPQSSDPSAHALPTPTYIKSHHPPPASSSSSALSRSSVPHPPTPASPTTLKCSALDDRTRTDPLAARSASSRLARTHTSVDPLPLLHPTPAPRCSPSSAFRGPIRYHHSLPPPPPATPSLLAGPPQQHPAPGSSTTETSSRSPPSHHTLISPATLSHESALPSSLHHHPGYPAQQHQSSYPISRAQSPVGVGLYPPDLSPAISSHPGTFDPSSVPTTTASHRLHSSHLSTASLPIQRRHSDRITARRPRPSDDQPSHRIERLDTACHPHHPHHHHRPLAPQHPLEPSSSARPTLHHHLTTANPTRHDQAPWSDSAHQPPTAVSPPDPIARHMRRLSNASVSSSSSASASLSSDFGAALSIGSQAQINNLAGTGASSLSTSANSNRSACGGDYRMMTRFEVRRSCSVEGVSSRRRKAEWTEDDASERGREWTNRSFEQGSDRTVATPSSVSPPPFRVKSRPMTITPASNHAGSQPSPLGSQPPYQQPSAQHRYQCLEPGCGKTFSRPSSLKIHSYSHTGQKPFKCLRCDRAFSVQSNLKRHQKVHERRAGQVGGARQSTSMMMIEENGRLNEGDSEMEENDSDSGVPMEE